MPEQVLIEICVDAAQAAVAAQQGGARRVELCAGLVEGGTTPSAGLIALTRQSITIGLHVLIRPRRGDFLYTDLEFEIMKQDIRVARQLGADGVVTGILQADGHIDMPRMQELVALAAPMSVTFHRAFDLAADPYKALDDLLALKIPRLLTSGQKATAFEGTPLIAELVRRAGDQLVIMPGGGVNEQNIREIVSNTGVTEIHTSARSRSESAMIFRRADVSMSGTQELSEYELLAADAARVSCLRQAAVSV
ncbi:copper homeostasis protein CutC [Pontibacter liquoris]|uniref:copper homeostasis protein CutC n=1 Tax=Pontibacter liquoris TaxID=2905677 RepID=UPI001FA6FE35|nr:copper homeostasis protein CutC [Pontibacter liquoris]